MASLEREDTLNTPRFRMLPRRTEHKVEVGQTESDRLPPVAVILQETLSLGLGEPRIVPPSSLRDELPWYRTK